jgi:hypothetical protein
MQAAVVDAFMIVDSLGHYSAQTVHDHGPPAIIHKYPVTLCRSMHNMHKRQRPPFGRSGRRQPGEMDGTEPTRYPV